MIADPLSVRQKESLPLMQKKPANFDVFCQISCTLVSGKVENESLRVPFPEASFVTLFGLTPVAVSAATS
jgi:hypothetical protein